MVLKKCSIKYSLLFYFTGFLGEAGDAWGVPLPLSYAGIGVGMAAVVLDRSQGLPALHPQHRSSGEVAKAGFPPPDPQTLGVHVCTAWDRDPKEGLKCPVPTKRHHGAWRLWVQRGLFGILKPRGWGQGV